MKKIILTAFAVCIGFLTACGNAGTQKTEVISGKALQADGKTQSVEEENSLVVAVSEEPPQGFDPTIKWPFSGDPLFQSMLYRFDENGQITQDLATNCDINDDNTEYTITIRDDAVCSDGVALTAKDVEFSYMRIPQTCTWVDYSMLERVEAVDDYTVKFVLNTPNSEFQYILAQTAIIPEHAYNEETYAQNPIGSGPYVLTKWDRGEKMVITANPNYYGTKPETERITFLFVNADTALALAKTGEVDIARISVNLADQDIEGYTKNVVNTNDGMSIYMPSVPFGAKEKDGTKLGNNVTSDVAVRQAISYAIDRQGMVDSILNGYGEPFYYLFEDTWFGNEEGSYRDNDVEKANAILDEAGWKDTDGDGIREKDGVKAEFTLYSVPQDQTYSPRQGICLAVQQRLKEIGIDMQIEFKQFAEIQEEKLLWQQAYLQGNGSDNPLEIYTQFSSSMMFNGTYNPTMYQNSVVDGYIDEALRGKTEEEITRALKKAQWDGTTGTNLYGDCVWIPVIKVNHIYYVKDGVDMALDRLRKAPHRGGTWTCTDTITLWKKNTK